MPSIIVGAGRFEYSEGLCKTKIFGFAFVALCYPIVLPDPFVRGGSGFFLVWVVDEADDAAEAV
jgi:hypothetical protein